MTRRKWFDREFELGLPISSHAALVERLRSTPARLEELLGGFAPSQATRRPGDAWSIAEQAGHLSDLEPLWLGRVDDLAAGLPRLRAADLENRATWAADHNARALPAILSEFRDRRAKLVERLESLSVSELRSTALHPRLEQPMTVADLCFFVAEHDDHHLGAIADLRRVAS